MGEFSIANSPYTYINDSDWPSEAVGVHHVVVRKSFLRRLCVPLTAVSLLANSVYLFLVKEQSVSVLCWSFLLTGFLLILSLWKPVYKESVIIMPAFGVQLETHYSSGRIVRSFVPVGKILKPVLLECVTPVTCYWSLSLIVRGEEELMLVFKELHPPLKILVPIWKALCAAIDYRGKPDAFREDG
ncbi:hypothetical protein SLEP1_g31824 [Rubroshorea leprosula]|uniref:Phosphatidylinositol N-acetylglucosaminyltransferase subunit H conserved domain-containing protein n=1 Tax=Rubroshorea leprosula TaxID=152421 RepID=A0AAV5KBE7_9ROSI|nr:hypothetical protein SLEP1_g31824 [Rubroshorea leprosula]